MYLNGSNTKSELKINLDPRSANEVRDNWFKVSVAWLGCVDRPSLATALLLEVYNTFITQLLPLYRISNKPGVPG